MAASLTQAEAHAALPGVMTRAAALLRQAVGPRVLADLPACDQDWKAIETRFPPTDEMLTAAMQALASAMTTWTRCATLPGLGEHILVTDQQGLRLRGRVEYRGHLPAGDRLWLLVDIAGGA